MNNKLPDVFTHIDDLREKEPEFFRRGFIDVDSNRPESSVTKNPIAILDEGIKRIYHGESAAYNFTSEGEPQATDFICTCQIRDTKASGKAKTKKLAKQIAAAEALKLIIRKDFSYGKEFGIQCLNLDEADNYINSISEKVMDSQTSAIDGNIDASDFDKNKNYIGALQEFCQKNKYPAVEYRDREEGSQATLMFIVTCKVGNEIQEGKAKKKKDAKSIAAYLMLKLLESSPSVEFYKSDLVIDEHIDNIDAPSRPSTVNPGKSMQDILDDKGKFNSYEIDHRILEKPCLTQCLLKLKLTAAGEKSEEQTYVFPGVGENDEEAKKQASLNALLFLETF